MLWLSATRSPDFGAIIPILVCRLILSNRWRSYDALPADYTVVIEGDRESDPLHFAEIDTASAFDVFELVVVAMR